MPTTTTFANLDVQSLDFNFFKGQDANSKKVYINPRKGARDAIRIQLGDYSQGNFLRVPFGVSDPPPNSPPNTTRFNMEIAIDDEDTMARVDGIVEAAIQYLNSNPQWQHDTKNPLTESEIRRAFTSPLRRSEGPGKSNLLRTKVMSKEDKYKTEVLLYRGVNPETKTFNMVRGSLEQIDRNCNVCLTLELSPMWFVGQDRNFGFSVKVMECIVDAREGSPGGASAVGGTAPGSTFILESGYSFEINEASEPSPKRAKIEQDQAAATESMDHDMDAGAAITGDPSNFL